MPVLTQVPVLETSNDSAAAQTKARINRMSFYATAKGDKISVIMGKAHSKGPEQSLILSKCFQMEGALLLAEAITFTIR